MFLFILPFAYMRRTVIAKNSCSEDTSLNPDAETEEYLDILTNIAESLGLDTLNFASHLAAVSDLSSEELSLKRTVLYLSQTEEQLAGYFSAATEGRLLRKWTETLVAEPESSESEATLDRRKAMLLTKAREYQKELVTVIASDPVYCTTYSIDAMPETPSLTISELAGYREGLHQKEHELKLRRAKLKAYQGLPPDVELARHELREARAEQTKLIQLREGLLANMTSGVS